MNLKLTIEEKDLLCEMIDRRLRELCVEIHRTDSLNYREGLEKENVILLALQDRLPALAVS